MAVPIEPHFVDSNHDALYAESINNPERFWGTLAKQRLRWMKDFHTVMDCDMNTGKISWFLGGKLNVSGKQSIDILTPVSIPMNKAIRTLIIAPNRYVRISM